MVLRNLTLILQVIDGGLFRNEKPEIRVKCILLDDFFYGAGKILFLRKQIRMEER